MRKYFRSAAVLGVLLFSAALSPALFSWYSGGWQHPTESTYRIYTGVRGDEVSHQRWLYEAGKNLRQGRVGTLAAIDEKQPINSSPQFQYYSVGIYALLAPLVNASGDVMLTYLVGLYLFS